MHNINASLIYLFISVLFGFTPDLSAKEACKKHLNKLHKIQDKQRKGHSLKSSNELNQQETAAIKEWRKCENTTIDKKKKKKKKNNTVTPIKNSTSKLITDNNTRSTLYNFETIIVKEKYEGEKKFAWLNFYQQPGKCKQPKDLHVFAFCAEDKQNQQTSFEQSYRVYR